MSLATRLALLGVLQLLLIAACYGRPTKTATAPAPELNYSFNPSDGSFAITFNNNTFLTSAPYGVHSGGNWYLNSARYIIATENAAGVDALGKFVALKVYWRFNQINFVTSFKRYPQYSNVLVFEQQLPNGLNQTATGLNTDVITAFPSFSTQTPTPLNFFSYWDKFAVPQIGQFGKTTLNAGSIGGVPLALWDEHSNAVVLSPLSNLMTGSQLISQALNGAYACGVQGMVEQLPPNFVQQFILVAGSGLNDTFYRWGELFQTRYDHVRVDPMADLTSSRVAYWTDNGAYYYYHTEANNNYSQTCIDARNYATSIGVNIGSFQLDSWWYFKGINNGLQLWEPRPNVFQNGILSVNQAMGNLPLTLHNRYFGSDNNYIGMGFPFIVEPPFALPTSEGLFTYIMAKAKKWGLTVYEQDWINVQYLSMNGTQNNVETGRQWLMNMGTAASHLGLKIQYCMPLPNSILQSVEVGPVVIQIRASDDYQPGDLNWQIAHSSLLLWSLGKVPFKDVFLTSRTNPGCPYTYCTEPNPELVSLVATLSTGPVGFGDGLGLANATILSMTSRQDGVILKPSKPATALDIGFLQFSGSAPQIVQLSGAFSQFVANFNNVSAPLLRWHSIIGADLPHSYSLYPKDLDLDQNEAYLAFNFANPKKTIQTFNNNQPLFVPSAPQRPQPVPHAVSYNYYIILPWSEWQNGGFAFLGELNKFVPVSPQRFSGFTVDGNNRLSSTVTGGAGEVVQVSWIQGGMSLDIRTVPCQLGRLGNANLVCDSNGCRC